MPSAARPEPASSSRLPPVTSRTWDTDHADMAAAVATNDNGGLRIGIAAGVDAIGGSIVERQQRAFEAEDGPGTGAFDAGARDALDADHGFEGQRGAVTAGFDKQEVLTAGALFVTLGFFSFRGKADVGVLSDRSQGSG